MRFRTVVIFVTATLGGMPPGPVRLTAAPGANQDDRHPGGLAPVPPVVVFSQDGIVQAVDWSFTADGGIVCWTTAGGDTPTRIPSPGFLDAQGSAMNGRDPAARALATPSATTASAPASGPAASRPARQGAAVACVQLANNEILRGTIQDSGSPDVLAIDVERLGPQHLSTKELVAISLTGRTTAVPSTDSGSKPPYLLLGNGDLLAGTIRGMGTGGVTVTSDFGDTRVEWSRVSNAVLSAAPTVLDGRRPGEFLCVLVDGQRWHANALAPGSTPRTVRLGRGRSLADVPVTSIRQLVFPGWTFQYLARLGTPTVEAASYLDEVVPTARDNAAHPRRCSIGGRWFDAGLTTRPRSRLTYTLPSPAHYLSGWVGLDTLRGRFGNCDASVQVAGQTIADFKGLTAEQGARRVTIPVPAGQQVSLTTDFGLNGEIGDYVNWCDLMVIARQADR